MASEYQPKTPLGRKLMELRARYAAAGGKFLNREQLDAEIARRRLGYNMPTIGDSYKQLMSIGMPGRDGFLPHQLTIYADDDGYVIVDGEEHVYPPDVLWDILAMHALRWYWVIKKNPESDFRHCCESGDSKEIVREIIERVMAWNRPA